MLKVSLIQAHIILGGLELTYSESYSAISDTCPDPDNIQREGITLVQDLSDLYPGILEEYPLCKDLAYGKST